MSETLQEKLLGVSAAYQRFLDMEPPLSSEPIPGKTYIADGWKYKDLPQLTAAQFETFQQIVGPESLVWLAHSEMQRGDVVTFRGQCLISPDGAARLKQYLEN